MFQDKKRQIKEAIRQLHVGIPPEQVKEEFREVLETALLCDLLQSHFFKENSILYPAALSVVTKEEWLEARGEFDEIGFCCFTPPALVAAAKTVQPIKP